MIKRFLTLTLLVFGLTACLPILFPNDNVFMTVERLGTANDGVPDTVTGTVHLGRTMTEVLVQFRGDGFSEEFIVQELEAGEHEFAVITDIPVACSVSGWFGGRQVFPIPCSAEEQ